MMKTSFVCNFTVYRQKTNNIPGHVGFFMFVCLFVCLFFFFFFFEMKVYKLENKAR